MLGAHPNLREDLLELRRMLEGQVAEWAAERRTDEDMERLTQTFEALQAVFDGEDRKRQAACDIAFHQAIADASHNVLLGHLTSTLLRLMEENICLNLTELGNVSRAFSLLEAQHARLFEAIRDRRPGAARSAAEVHIDFVHESLAQSLRSAARREAATRRLKGNDFSTDSSHTHLSSN